MSAGGRGGRTYVVSNLNDSGPGSLRDCVEAEGPRNCVFKVGGVIRLRRGFEVRRSYLTVAGQTAPGVGIALSLNNHQCSGRVFNIQDSAHDIVIRYLRIWGDYTMNVNPKTCPGTAGVSVWGGSYNIIVDHCTILWHSGAAFGVWAERGGPGTSGRMTVSWSLLGENTFGATGLPQSTLALVAADDYDPAVVLDVDFHHNLLVSADHRVPLVNGRGRVVNNVIYNFVRGSMVDSGNNPGGAKSSWDFIGNQWKAGPFANPPWSGYAEINLNRGATTVYTENNISNWHKSDGSEADGGWFALTAYSPSYQGGGENPGHGLRPAPDAHKRAPWARLPAPARGIDITPERISGDSLIHTLSKLGGAGMSRRLACDGRWVNVYDRARNRILAYVRNGAGPRVPFAGAALANGGALPVIATVPGCADADRDGIPDVYEKANSLNKNDAEDARIMRPDGYTNLEHYLNGK